MLLQIKIQVKVCEVSFFFNLKCYDMPILLLFLLEYNGSVLREKVIFKFFDPLVIELYTPIIVTKSSVLAILDTLSTYFYDC